MRSTVLRVTEARHIPLLEGHLWRLGAHHQRALEQHAEQALPGLYVVRASDTELRFEPRARSRLQPGLPVRWRPSPLPGEAGPIVKPATPGIYDAVRDAAFITLLTDDAGALLYEADSAALLSWDGQRFVVVPAMTPRVLSVAERAVRASLDPRSAPLRRDDDSPLVLINAAVGAFRLELPGRASLPESALLTLVEVLSR